MRWRIAVAAIVLVVVPPMLIAAIEVGPWVKNLREWQTGLGAYWGSLFGLGAILIGALYNAKLNRDHADWVRNNETSAMAAAFHAEVLAVSKDLGNLLSITEGVSEARSQTNKSLNTPITDAAKGFVENFSTFDVYNSNCEAIGLLGPTLASALVTFYRIARVLFHAHARISLAAAVDEDTQAHISETQKFGERLASDLAAIAKLPPNRQIHAVIPPGLVRQ